MADRIRPALAQETACSVLRPPNTTATRILRCPCTHPPVLSGANPPATRTRQPPEPASHPSPPATRARLPRGPACHADPPATLICVPRGTRHRRHPPDPVERNSQAPACTPRPPPLWPPDAFHTPIPPS